MPSALAHCRDITAIRSIAFLIAQGLVENLTLVSNEAVFERYGVQRLWN